MQRRGVAHYRAGSIFWLAVGIYIAAASYQMGLGTLHQPGSGFIFFVASLILVVLGAVDLGLTFIGQGPARKDFVWSSVRWPKVVAAVAAIFIYIGIFHSVGFFLSTFLLMIFLFKAVEPTKWWVAILGSCITVLISYSVFELWLKVPFPQGVLGF